MLILTRKEGEKVIITLGNEVVEVMVAGFYNGDVRLGFKAPKNVTINREEIQRRIDG